MAASSSLQTLWQRWFGRLFPFLLLAVLFVGVVHARPTPWFRMAMPDVAFDPKHCTWFCHNHGCDHQPVVPGTLTSDEGLFGQTVHGLYALGRAFSNHETTGYGIANLLVFCIGWPAVTYALWLRFLRQRETLKELHAKRAGASSSAATRSEGLGKLGFAIYAACVDFMLNLASLLGITYRDANALVLLVGFPLTTSGLFTVCLWQRWQIRRLRRLTTMTATRAPISCKHLAERWQTLPKPPK
jgi:hypothetical protein